MRTVSVARAVFAVTLMGLGIIGLLGRHLDPIWHSIPADLPARGALTGLCALLSLACGIGLLWRGSAATAARVLLALLLLCLVLLKLPDILRAPAVAVAYESCGETAVLVAAAWVLYASLATGWERRWLAFLAGPSGARHARVLYGLAMLAFGVSHFAYLQFTATLVPAWLPVRTAWVYFTGSAYIAAGVGLIAGVYARLAAALSALQMSLFTLLVWIPAVAVAHPNAAALRELADSWTLSAGGWVLADSCRGMPWLARGAR